MSEGPIDVRPAIAVLQDYHLTDDPNAPEAEDRRVRDGGTEAHIAWAERKADELAAEVVSKEQEQNPGSRLDLAREKAREATEDTDDALAVLDGLGFANVQGGYLRGIGEGRTAQDVISYLAREAMTGAILERVREEAGVRV